MKGSYVRNLVDPSSTRSTTDRELSAATFVADIAKNAGYHETTL